MARTETTASRERVTVIRRYPWPENLLNWWTIVMLATGGLLTGVFGDFMSIQNRMGLGTPWLFPYAVTVGSLTIFWIIIMIILMAQKKLQPAWVMLASFILIALFLAGLIETAIQLFGNVSIAAPSPFWIVLTDIFSGQRINLLQPLRKQQQHPRRQHRHPRLAGTKLHLFAMGRRFRFLDYRIGLLGLDDDYGFSGE